MKTAFFALLMVGAATPAVAQSAAANSGGTASATAVADPARVAAAKAVVDKLWPAGTYRRIMEGTMSPMLDSMMESMLGMKLSDMTAPMDKNGKAAKELGDVSLGQLAGSADPYFRERVKITMETMLKGMTPVLESIEPQMRTSLTNIYSRRFTVVQLGDMAAFFSTPSGAAYAEQSMLVFADPEIVKGMQSFIPEMLKAMPGIMKDVEAATAHLPPPPKPKAEAGETNPAEKPDDKF